MDSRVKVGGVLAGTAPEGASSSPSGAEVREQLERILSSAGFVASERLCRFLRWAVEQALAGNIGGLKEYSLGRDVFDRRDDYDPRVDSIVRVEAQRLRRKLREYYAGPGSADAIVIEIPARGYVPAFQSSQTTAAVRRPAASLLDPLTVAVLPFLHLGPDPDENLLCEGIAEEILTELARAPELKVLAQGSSSGFGAADLDLRDIGQRLGAGTLVRGSVRCAGGRVRISAGAVDARSGEVVWTHSFDRGLEDIFAIQVEIAQAVSLTLRGSSLPGPGLALTAAAPSAEAYTAYLRGRHDWRQLTIPGCRNAIAKYQSCIARFPDYAQPYAALALAQNWLAFFGGARPAETALVSRRAAQQALQLDPQIAEGYVTLGGVTGLIDWNWAESERLLQRGVALRPGSVSGLTSLAFHYSARGQVDRAWGIAQRMLEFDPLSPEALHSAAYNRYHARDYKESVHWLDRANHLSRGMPHSYLLVARALVAVGRQEEVIQRLQESQSEQPDGLLLGALADVLALCGKKKQAHAVIARIQALAAQTVVSPMAFAYAYAGLGLNDEVLAWLERATDESWTAMGCVALDPRFDPVRSHPRFQAILKRMNLG